MKTIILLTAILIPSLFCAQTNSLILKISGSCETECQHTILFNYSVDGKVCGDTLIQDIKADDHFEKLLGCNVSFTVKYPVNHEGIRILFLNNCGVRTLLMFDKLDNNIEIITDLTKNEMSTCIYHH